MKKARQPRGSVLATVLMLSFLLAIITAVVASSALHNFRTTNISGDISTSRYVGFAGIQHAMLYLKDDATYDGNFEERVPGNEELHYKVRVKNSKTGSYPTSEVPENCARIEVEVVQMRTGQVDRTTAGMVGTAAWRPTAFDNAATARSFVSLGGGSKTMAFDFWDYTDEDRENRSTDMDSGYVDPEPSGSSTPSPGGGTTADIQCNQFVNVSADSKVEGDVTAPPVQSTDDGPMVADPSGGGGIGLSAARQILEPFAPDIAALMNNLVAPEEGTTVTGRVKEPIAAPDIQKASPPYDPSEATQVKTDFPSQIRRDQNGNPVTDWNGNPIRDPASLTPAAYKEIVVPQGQKLVLTPGRYYISDKFQIDGEIEIQDDGRGDVVVYVGQTMEVNGRVNFSGDPAKMQVYFTDEKKPVDENGNPITPVVNPLNPAATEDAIRGYSELKMNSNSKATMVVQGANLITHLDHARLLGAVAGRAISLTNDSSIEYDTHLKGRQMAGASPWKLEGVYEKK